MDAFLHNDAKQAMKHGFNIICKFTKVRFVRDVMVALRMFSLVVDSRSFHFVRNNAQEVDLRLDVKLGWKCGHFCSDCLESAGLFCH